MLREFAITQVRKKGAALSRAFKIGYGTLGFSATKSDQGQTAGEDRPGGWFGDGGLGRTAEKARERLPVYGDDREAGRELQRQGRRVDAVENAVTARDSPLGGAQCVDVTGKNVERSDEILIHAKRRTAENTVGAVDAADANQRADAGRARAVNGAEIGRAHV